MCETAPVSSENRQASVNFQDLGCNDLSYRSTLDTQVHTRVVRELRGNEIPQFLQRPLLHFRDGVRWLAMFDGELDRLGRFDNVKKMNGRVEYFF